MDATLSRNILHRRARRARRGAVLSQPVAPWREYSRRRDMLLERIYAGALTWSEWDREVTKIVDELNL